MFSVGAEGVSCSLYVLYAGLGISKLLFLIKKYILNISLFFGGVLIIKNLDPDPDSLEMLDLDPDSMYKDSQHCLEL